MQSTVTRSVLFGGFIAAVLSNVAFAEDRSKTTTAETKIRKTGFDLIRQQNALKIHLDGRFIGSYVFRHKHVKRPFFAHLKTRAGVQVTRRFPPRKGIDATDHATMHPGLWLGFGKLGGSDFWRNKGRVVHERFDGKPKVDRKSATFVTINRYERPDGSVVCRQRTRYTLSKQTDGWLLTIDTRFSSKKPFAFGVQEEMGLGVRVATPLTVKNGGAILASHGGTNEKGTWGKTGRWWDYFGTIKESSVGVMIMSHPTNRPVWSHSRDYGCLVANPFPVDRKENRGKTTVVKPGGKLRLRFGVLIHDHATGKKFDRKAVYRSYAGRK